MDDPETGTIHLYADRFRWGPFGTLFAHLSLVLILVGALIGGAMGFKNTDSRCRSARRSTSATGPAWRSRRRASPTPTTRTASPSDYASDLVLYKDGQQVADQTIRVNQPLRYGDVTFYQSFFGPPRRP